MHSSTSIVRCISDINIRICCKRDIPRRETDVYLTYCTVAFSRSFLACAFTFLIFSVSPPAKWKETLLFTFHLFAFWSCLIKDNTKRSAGISYRIPFLLVPNNISVDEYFVLIYLQALLVKEMSSCLQANPHAHPFQNKKFHIQIFPLFENVIHIQNWQRCAKKRCV